MKNNTEEIKYNRDFNGRTLSFARLKNCFLGEGKQTLEEKIDALNENITALRGELAAAEAKHPLYWIGRVFNYEYPEDAEVGAVCLNHEDDILQVLETIQTPYITIDHETDPDQEHYLREPSLDFTLTVEPGEGEESAEPQEVTYYGWANEDGDAVYTTDDGADYDGEVDSGSAYYTTTITEADGVESVTVTEAGETGSGSPAHEWTSLTYDFSHIDNL